ncbi:hypothetical protein BDQ12DRAFT_677300, partial [Crucibulum laeve]
MGREIVDHEVTLASSPWTYENEGLNPALQPSNVRLRNSKQREPRPIPEGSSLPPYHPDYREGDAAPYEPNSSDEDTISISSDTSPLDGDGRIHVRSGSEGYEVRPQGREDMLRRYLEELGEEPGRYIRYIPEPDVDSDSEDDIPLSRTMETRNIV